LSVEEDEFMHGFLYWYWIKDSNSSASQWNGPYLIASFLLRMDPNVICIWNN
jgi:hypothetical protein